MEEREVGGWRVEEKERGNQGQMGRRGKILRSEGNYTGGGRRGLKGGGRRRRRWRRRERT